MSSVAYKNKARTIIISAKNAKLENKGTRYYCFNRECEAELYFAHTSGTDGGHFRAYPTTPHNKDCEQACSGSRISISDYNEKEFNLDSLIDSFLLFSANSPKSNRKILGGRAITNQTSDILQNKRIKTISQLYFLMKSLGEKESYNGYVVGFTLIDRRSIRMNTKGVFGRKLVEAKVSKGYFYNKDLKEIYLEIPNDTECKYKFILRFKDFSLYTELSKLIYENKDYFIVVGGEWKKERINVFYTYIENRKQIYIVKD